jgi:hypothetical protein
LPALAYEKTAGAIGITCSTKVGTVERDARTRMYIPKR